MSEIKRQKGNKALFPHRAQLQAGLKVIKGDPCASSQEGSVREPCSVDSGQACL